MKKQIMDAIKVCMKEKLKTELSGLRMANAAIKNKEIDLKRELTNDEIVAIIKKQIKEHNQSLSYLTDEDTQQEEIIKYKTYISVLENFLPEEMSAQEVGIIVKNVLTSNNIVSKSQMGEAMKLCKIAFADSGVDNAMISIVVRGMLA